MTTVVDTLPSRRRFDVDEYHAMVRAGILMEGDRVELIAAAHATPSDTLLVIEVADSSLAYDRKVKLPLYDRSASRATSCPPRGREADEGPACGRGLGDLIG